MERITIHVPELLPDGSPVPPHLIARFEERLLDVTLEAKLASNGVNEEGFTIVTGVVGAWRSTTGRTYREPLCLYYLDVADARFVHDRVLEIADGIRAALKQEAVYVTVAPIEPMLVREAVAA
jgi:hypothetical protein